MRSLKIVENVFNASNIIEVKTDDVLATLQQRYSRFPDTARLYCRQVSTKTDVTPKDETDIEALKNMQGDFWVVIYPAGIETLAYFAYALIAVVAIVAITMRPKVPNSASRNYQSSSPNNALSDRTNTARVNNRIPDIFGTVRSTPDLLAVPYSIFKNHIEYEYCFMCIGRGYYEINRATVRDGQTPVASIEGESVAIYSPFSSPNLVTTLPQTIGDPIDRNVIAVVKSKSANGQALLAPNESDNTENYNNLVTFIYPNIIQAIADNSVTFLGKFFSPGDFINVLTSDVEAGMNAGSALLSGNHNVTLTNDGRIIFTDGDIGDIGTYINITNAQLDSHNFNGKYIVISNSSGILILQSPSDSNADWNQINSEYGSETPEFVATFEPVTDIIINFTGVYKIQSVSDKQIILENPSNSITNNNWVWMPGLSFNGGDNSYGFDGATVTIGEVSGDENWIGPFVLDVPTMTEVICNFIALNGMYKDDGTAQTATSVDIQVGITPCTSLGVATGPEIYFGITVVGSAGTQSTRAATMFADLPTAGRYMVRARRITSKDLTFVGTVVDEVKWRDLYASSPLGAVNWGNVTTVMAVTQATQQALAVSERQLNMLVTRKLPPYNGDGTFDTAIENLVATNSAADIISFISLDPKLGNRQPEEINFDQIYSTIDDIKAYFADPVAGDFSYTFDSNDLSYEEMITSIASAVFCTAHRRGRVIELLFEKETTDAILLFNHRNKVPGSETRTTNFGAQNDNDGIEFNYVSDIDDAVITFYVPEDQTAVNAKSVDSIGVRTTQQAYWHAYREYNKLLYQTKVTTFNGLQESELVTVGSQILVADNTRPDTQDGEIVAQDGLVITLSQPVVIQENVDYAIYLQFVSGIVQIISITAGASPYQVVLDAAPSEPLRSDDDDFVKTLYQIVRDTDVDNRTFLVTEKTPQSNFVSEIVAANYDARYYQNDRDLISTVQISWFSDVNDKTSSLSVENAGSGEFLNDVSMPMYFGVVAYSGQTVVWSFVWTPDDFDSDEPEFSNDTAFGAQGIIMPQSDSTTLFNGVLVISAAIDSLQASNQIQLTISGGSGNTIVWGTVL